MKNITLEEAKNLANIYKKVLSPKIADLMTSKMFKNQF